MKIVLFNVPKVIHFNLLLCGLSVIQVYAQDEPKFPRVGHDLAQIAQQIKEINLAAEKFALSLSQDPALNNWYKNASREDRATFKDLCNEYIGNVYTIHGMSEGASRLSSYVLQAPERAEWYHNASDKDAEKFLADCDLRAQCVYELQKKFSDRK